MAKKKSANGANGATTTISKPLKINRLVIENWLGITFQEVDANGQHIQIEGRNGSGKTSCVNAVWTAIRGLSRQQFPEAVHDNEEQARLTLDLGQFVIVRTITEDGMDLEITMADGEVITHKPQSFLDSLIPRLGFDLGKFHAMSPKEQLKAFLEFVSVEPPVEEVERITGRHYEVEPDESAVDYLSRLAADEKGYLYIERRRLHVVATQKEHAWQEAARHLAAIGGPLADGEGEVSLATLAGQQQDLNKQAEQRRQAMAAVVDAKRDRDDAAALLDSVTAAVDQKYQEIQRLEESLRAARDAQHLLMERIAKGKVIVADLEKDLVTAAERADKVIDPAPYLAELQQTITSLEAQNAAVRGRQHAQQTAHRLADEHTAAEAEHTEADVILTEVRGLWTHLLDDTNINIDGLTIGDGELRLFGRPFRQASEGERLIAGFGIYRLQDPKPPFLLFDGAERLDADNRQLLLKLADEAGCQVLATAVASGPLKISCGA